MTNEFNKDQREAEFSSGSEPAISSEQLRKRFRAFVNDDAQFRKFIQCCNKTACRRGWLTFWQQELWTAFVDSNAELARLESPTLIDAFYVCHVHLLPLQTVEVPIRKGMWCVTHTREVEERIGRDAPYSTPYVLDSSAWGAATHVTVDHCDQCLAQREELFA